MKFDKRTIELIALGASVAANCRPCLEYHSKKALEAGITELEIKDAIEVGRTVRNGAASKMDEFVTSLSGESTTVPCGGSTGCQCG